MPNQASELSTWQAVYADVSADVLKHLSRVVERHVADLAAGFSVSGPLPTAGVGASDPSGRAAQVVPVSGAMERWLVFLLDDENRVDPSPVVRMQQPLAHLLMDAGWCGLRLVGAFIRQKQLLRQWLREEGGSVAFQLAALGFLERLCDASLLAVMEAQQAGKPAPVSAVPITPPEVEDAAAAGQWSATALEQEREASIAVLTEEENRYLRAVLEFGHAPEDRSMGSSVFGIWVSQRAPLLFDDSALDELNRISHTLTHLDGTVLPTLADWLTRRIGTRQQAVVIRELVSDIADIRQQLNALFDRITRVDGYRDALTQLFSRPFVPTMLRREIELARRRQSGFSVLVLDIGNFQDLRSQHGVHAGDRLLKQLAGVLSSQVRASDWVFRYGSGAFMVLLAELSADASRPVAEKLLRQLLDVVQQGHELAGFALFLNGGVAAYDGDPDPVRLTDRADAAVQAARGVGACEVCVAA